MKGVPRPPTRSSVIASSAEAAKWKAPKMATMARDR
jgi:hypothetical protein